MSMGHTRNSSHARGLTQSSTPCRLKGMRRCLHPLKMERLRTYRNQTMWLLLFCAYRLQNQHGACGNLNRQAESSCSRASAHLALFPLADLMKNALIGTLRILGKQKGFREHDGERSVTCARKKESFGWR